MRRHTPVSFFRIELCPRPRPRPCPCPCHRPCPIPRPCLCPRPWHTSVSFFLHRERGLSIGLLKTALYSSYFYWAVFNLE